MQAKHRATENRTSFLRRCMRHALHPVVHIGALIGLHVAALMVIDHLGAVTAVTTH